MIRHCVFVKFRADVTAAEREAIYDGLRALKGKIDGLSVADFGPNVSPEGLAQGFADGFIMDFTRRRGARRLPRPPRPQGGRRQARCRARRRHGWPPGVRYRDREPIGTLKLKITGRWSLPVVGAGVQVVHRDAAREITWSSGRNGMVRSKPRVSRRSSSG